PLSPGHGTKAVHVHELLPGLSTALGGEYGASMPGLPGCGGTSGAARPARWTNRRASRGAEPSALRPVEDESAIHRSWPSCALGAATVPPAFALCCFSPNRAVFRAAGSEPSFDAPGEDHAMSALASLARPGVSLPSDQDASGRTLGQEELDLLAAVIDSGTLT